MQQRIGIVGGGQLGRMLAQAAHTLGFYVTILDPTPNSPAGQVSDAQIVGSVKDKEKIFKLAEVSDFITFEIESANAEALEKVMAKGIPVNPEPKTLKIIKDKFEQKVFLANHKIPVAKFALISKEEDCVKQGDIFGYPFLLKARFDAYDGRGNYVVKKASDIPEALNRLSKSPLYAEKFVPFIKELSVVSARDQYGKIISFPVVETIHKNNICHIVRSPAPVPEEVRARAEALAREVLKALSGVGVFAVEMFLIRGGEVLVNEIAPRVHNSGHHTIEAFSVSQFEQQIRVITGMHIAEPKKNAKTAVMINILGERNGPADLTGVPKKNMLENAKVHIYGKIETKLERKMGHITVLAETLEEAEEKAIKIRKKISI